MCPFCREQIITIARVRTWDTFLTRVYNLVSTENRESREQILRERQEERNESEERRENLRAENGDRPRRPLPPTEMREVHHQHVWEDLFVQAAPVAQGNIDAIQLLDTFNIVDCNPIDHGYGSI